MLVTRAVSQVPDSLPPPGLLKQMSLEQLMAIEVSSVSRRPERLSETASAIQVITRDDIRRSGATRLPEALRLATNLEVDQLDASQWAISARGFNSPLANKLLVLIDGRTVYSPLFAGVFWDQQDVLLEDIEQIEVISGPGATAWGANAVNGVINITTRPAKDTQGLLAVGAGGTELHGLGAVRYGGAIGSNRAEVAWLDGLAAAGRRDRRALAEARAALRGSGDPGVNPLDRSLAAFDAALTGATRVAGTAMAALEWQEAALAAWDFTRHPYTIAVDRLAAARWLAATGDAERALQLLTWVDGPYFIHPSTVYSLMLTPLVDLERGRIEEQKGRAGPARNYYREFLRRYDRPVIGHRRLVEEAKTAVVRLTGRGD
jgi:outer membrane receptor protein involved in Fe transport